MSADSGKARSQAQLEKILKAKLCKRRHSSIRTQDLCHVRIKVTRPVDGTTVTIERLDEHTHNHDIEESFRIKKPSILINSIKAEAVKNYSASQIFHALRGAGTHEGSERLQVVGGASLTRHDIANLKRGTKTEDKRNLPYGTNFEDDVKQACGLLTEKKWLYEELQVIDSKKECRWGLVFADPKRLLILQRRGWFTQFDATHKLNRWSHNMFSFLIRNEHNIWIPAVHLVVERENGDIIAEGLRTIKKWCNNKWQPVYRLLKQAMYCFTQIKNQELCMQAIATASSMNDQETAKYIQTHWLQTASKWAMYARQHSPLLLQVTTTNACEAWHRKLKSGAGLSKGQVASHGIYGMILNIMDAANDVDNRAAVAKSHFRNRKLAICTKQYPEIGQLPVPIQKLLASELDAVAERIAKGKEVPTSFEENLQCYCKFYRQYLLPCRHIFHLDTEIKVLTTIRWQEYVMMFAECGMEVYETIGTVWVELETSERRNRSANSIVLQLRESMERFQQKIYAVQEAMDQMSLEETIQSAWLGEWKKLQLTQETNPDVHKSIYEDLMDQLSRFGIVKERDYQRRLGKKELKLGRVLDGEEIARLYKVWEEADQKKATKMATKCQRAQTSATGPGKSKTSSKTSGKTSRRKRSTKPHRGKQKAADPIDIPSDSSSYYEITNESEDDLEPPGASTPAAPSPQAYPRPLNQPQYTSRPTPAL
ncbi:hypothetical protein EV426DRAFT_711386 [Tirmania nivea]|nr:hypothetical protein EV426DRAFT_711386 [Tirmania nivea]